MDVLLIKKASVLKKIAVNKGCNLALDVVTFLGIFQNYFY
jgi:hypothetical protein